MIDAESVFVSGEEFLEFLKALPWCKQGDKVLVAVYQLTPEIIGVIQGHEVRVFPGGMVVKMTKSTIHHFREKFEEGQPLPVVLVWKPEGIEIWYRRHKSADFPYDAWIDPAAAAYEKERVFIPRERMAVNSENCHRQIINCAKECPSSIPPQ